MPEYVLIVASSGRMLAQAAHRAGCKPFVIDLYADRDTCLYAQETLLAASLALKHILPALEAFFARIPLTYAIYGSGFENHPESLSYLADRLTLLGNPPDVFIKSLNKKYFFSVLDQLSIPYPHVVFTKPKNSSDAWLTKPLQGHGGVGIKHYRQTENDSSLIYWQHYTKGTSHSVLFLADGENLQIIGFNNQWSVQSGLDDFIFSGISNDGNISDQHKSRITEWLTKIVPAFTLKGLNSLDFICTAGNCYMLEINARPPASMQLYDESLFSRHINACLGQLCEPPPARSHDYKAYQILYAEHDTHIPTDFAWPSWCMDLPQHGALIHTGQPVCSIIASHKQSQKIRQQLVIKQQIIIDQLDKGIFHGI
jgi:uncharacterized protein